PTVAAADGGVHPLDTARSRANGVRRHSTDDRLQHSPAVRRRGRRPAPPAIARPAMSDITAQFTDIVGDHHLLTGDAIPEDYWHDEVITKPPQRPAYLAKPQTAEQVSQLLKAAS